MFTALNRKISNIWSRNWLVFHCPSREVHLGTRVPFLLFINNVNQNPFLPRSKILNCNQNINNRYFGISNLKLSEAELEEVADKNPIDPAKDRSKIIPPETSIRYLKSAAYKETYGDEPVWVKYRRNFKGQFVPRKTRKTCIRGGVLTTGNPCPICRDEYLVLHYTNVELLKQFIHPQTGEIINSRFTHVCQKKLLELEVAIVKAKFYGLLTYEVPFREYDYKEYYPNWKE